MLIGVMYVCQSQQIAFNLALHGVALCTMGNLKTFASASLKIHGSERVSES